MKEHQKELIIIPLNSSVDGKLTTAKILYNNYEIGTCEFQVGPVFPSITPTPTAPTAPTALTAPTDSIFGDLLLAARGPIKAATIGAPFNTQYTYTLIFDKKEDDNNTSLNIAMDSIQTNGFYKLNGGVFVNLSNLNIPSGTYKNIGLSPEGIRYNLELITSVEESKIILSRIC